MNNIGIIAVPLLIFIIVSSGFVKKLPIFTLFLEGAKDGLITVKNITPSLIGLVVAVKMFSASGALDLICNSLNPVLSLIGFPSELLPLAILRPVSGSGTLTILNSVLERVGSDSFIGDVACVMCGSSETTFYATTLYFGSIGIKNTRHTLVCGLLADLASVIASVITVRLILY